MSKKKPTKYSKKVAEFLCSKIEQGMNPTNVVKNYPDQMCSYGTIWVWRREHKEFREMLDLAYESYIMLMIDEMDDITRNKTPLHFDREEARAYADDRRIRLNALDKLTGRAAAVLTKRFDTKQTIVHEGENLGGPQIIIQSYAKKPEDNEVIDITPVANNLIEQGDT